MGKIDLSTIALILLAVAPGLAARRARRRMSAQSFEQVGPAAELGELATLSLAVHSSVIFLVAGVLASAGRLSDRDALGPFKALDEAHLGGWFSTHPSEALVLCSAYAVSSLCLGYALGLLVGWWQLRSPLSRFVEGHPHLNAIARRLGVFSVLEEKPLSYELFAGEAIRRNTNLVFLSSFNFARTWASSRGN